jgi:hypothetical protein
MNEIKTNPFITDKNRKKIQDTGANFFFITKNAVFAKRLQIKKKPIL